MIRLKTRRMIAIFCCMLMIYSFLNCVCVRALDIVTDTSGDSSIRTVCSRVDSFDTNLSDFIENLYKTMKDDSGIGIAAPQVGDTRRIFLTGFANGNTGKDYTVYINPEISSEGGSQVSIEGCLSVPGYKGIVFRPETINIKAYDVEGNEFNQTLTGDEARVCCHERDHLDGILYTDKAKIVLSNTTATILTVAVTTVVVIAVAALAVSIYNWFFK